MHKRCHRSRARVLAVARVLVCALVLCTVTAAAGCTAQQRAGRLELTGVIVGDDAELQVPALATPMPDVTVGFPSAATATSSPSPRVRQASSSSALALLGLGSRARVESMPVQPGDSVETGDVVAVLEHAVLDANVRSAQSAARAAAANVRLVESRLTSATTTQSDLATKQADVAKTIADLKNTRSSLATQLASARSALATLAAIQLPSTPPTLTPGGIPGAAQLEAQKAQLRAGIAQLTSAIAKLDAGIAKAEAGLAAIESGNATLSDAQTALANLRELARIAQDASTVGVDLALARAEQAVVRSPVNGTVIQTASAGDVLAPGAPLAVIRRATSRQVEMWVDQTEIGQVRLGQAASVRIDSQPGSVFSARVTLVGGETGFPPTSNATRIVHMIRAVPFA